MNSKHKTNPASGTLGTAPVKSALAQALSDAIGFLNAKYFARTHKLSPLSLSHGKNKSASAWTAKSRQLIAVGLGGLFVLSSSALADEGKGIYNTYYKYDGQGEIVSYTKYSFHGTDSSGEISNSNASAIITGEQGSYEYAYGGSEDVDKLDKEGSATAQAYENTLGTV